MDESIIIILISIFSILVFAAIVAFSKWRELLQERELRKLVAWSVLWDQPFGNVSGHDLPLWSYISNAQIEFNLQQEYRIDGDEEWAFVKEILEEYQKDLTLSYFKGYLKVIKSKYVIHGEDYFMFTLHDFLAGHQCDYEFLGHDMHKERLEYKRYDDWGGSCYDATYSLTDFAIVYHKLYYIAYLFCKNSKIINHQGETFQNERFLEDILDTKQIRVSRF